MTRASGGNLARTPGLHPTLYEKCHGIFNDHRESGPRFNVSSEYCLIFVTLSKKIYCICIIVRGRVRVGVGVE